MSMKRSAVTTSTVVCFLLTGCMVGPDFERPQLHEDPKWSSLDPATLDAATAAKPTDGVPDLTRWWASFNDPVLTMLVERAALGNLDLTAAEARIRAARARRSIMVGGLLPAVDAFGSAAHKPDFSSTGGPVVADTNLFAAGFDASWEIDIFGHVRRGIEASEADVDAAVFDMRDVWVSLAGEVASTYTDLRAAQAQLAIVRSNLSAQQDALDLTTRLYEAGIVGALDVSNARAQVESTRSRLPIFESVVREAICTLGVLLGQQPSALLAELSQPAAMPSVPKEVLVGMPSDLLKRRPDIRRAEAELHAATARIGVAIADQFPRLSLNGALGTQSTSSSDLIGSAQQYWSGGVNVMWPVFEGGRIQANIALQKALTDAAIAAYRKRVLVALRDVEVAIVNFSQEQARRASLARSVEANVDAVGLSTQLYLAGRSDFLNVIATQRALLDGQQALIQSEQAIANDLVALYKALGGGWEQILLNDGEAVSASTPIVEPPSGKVS
ncbi:MAG: efflux transporter outer membrane subunit [Planctomycetota bacterium]|nr:MAG: efflux transporter outer membrane subunit [Planctomycetota bacterium]